MRHDKIQRSIVVGACVLIIGVLALLDSTHIFYTRDILEFWPTIFIVFGLLKIYQTHTNAGYLLGSALLLIGISSTLSHLGWFHFHIHWWPLLLIIGGILMIVNRGADSVRNRPASAMPIDSGTESSGGNARFDIVAIMSGNAVKNDDADFHGGEITAVLGGVDLDLRQAQIVHEAVINVFVMWGGIALKVPNDWAVVTQGVPILGGIDDKTTPPLNASKRLIIKGVVLMGGLEIKN